MVHRTVWTCGGFQGRHIKIEDVPEEHSFFPRDISLSSIDTRKPRAMEAEPTIPETPITPSLIHHDAMSSWRL
jgi:hypothetical protein